MTSFDGSDIRNPAGSAKSRVVEDRWVQVDQAFADAVTYIVEVS
jgi:hypothetical protein